MIKAWNKFLDTCYGDEGENVRMLLGSLFSDPKPHIGHTYILIGRAGTGKSTLTNWLNKWVYHEDNTVQFLWDADPRQIPEKHDKIIFIETNREPVDLKDPNIHVIHTTGNRIPFEEYRHVMKVLDSMPIEIMYDCIAAFRESGIV